VNGWHAFDTGAHASEAREGALSRCRYEAMEMRGCRAAVPGGV